MTWLGVVVLFTSDVSRFAFPVFFGHSPILVLLPPDEGLSALRSLCPSAPRSLRGVGRAYPLHGRGSVRGRCGAVLSVPITEVDVVPNVNGFTEVVVPSVALAVAGFTPSLTSSPSVPADVGCGDALPLGLEDAADDSCCRDAPMSVRLAVASNCNPVVVCEASLHYP